MVASDAILAENANPNTTPLAPPSKPPRGKKRVSISPKKPGVRHFAKDEEEDITSWGLDDSSDEETNVTKKSTKPRRRRRSSARFLRLSGGSAAAAEEDADAPEGEFTSSEHLGEIYRQAIRMNAENKINAGNSWGLKLIENMDKFIEEVGVGSAVVRWILLCLKVVLTICLIVHQDESSGAPTPRENERKFKTRDEKGRVNFTKASCTLDASVKIYSYRVDDVHLSSYRVLANLNRTDNKEPVDEEGGEVVEEGAEKTIRKKNVEKKGSAETIESNLGVFMCRVFVKLVVVSN
jgi:condensin complex subunit 2